MVAANSTDAEVRLQAKIQREIQQRRMKALHRLLDSEDFRTFWAVLMERTNYRTEVFHGNSRDAYEKGKRAVGMTFYADLVQLGEIGLDFSHEVDLQYMREQKRILASLLDEEKGV